MTRTAIALAALAAAGCAPAAARAVTPPATLVSLGDSFSSGEGAPPFDPAAGRCHRSLRAWPVLVADDLGMSGRLLACSGARIGDVSRAQVAALTAAPSPRVVTVTAGGNDAGFAAVVAHCAVVFRCDRSFVRGGRDQLRERIESLRRPLVALYRRIARAAPGAWLAAVGYPRLFPVHPARFTCAALGLIGPAEIRYLNARTADLDRVIAGAAREAGARYVDVQAAFDSHAVSCRGPQWVNHLRLGSHGSWSFHPTATGQRRLAHVIGRALSSPAGEH